MKNVVIADGHDLFRETLVSFLRSDLKLDFVSSISSPFKMASLLKRDADNILIIDPCEFPHESISLIRENIIIHDCLKVIVLTDSISRRDILNLIECGAAGIYSKKISFDKFCNAVMEIINSSAQFDVKLGTKIREQMVNSEVFMESSSSPSDYVFSKRELQVLDLICNEKTNKEISEILGLSVRTIETHRKRMMDKTESKNIIGVILYALKVHPNIIRKTEQLTQF